ncbi:MAG: phosphotransferase [Verrucomicrobiota bacterium]
MRNEEEEEILLKRGYWDETRVFLMPDGSRRVRKSSRAGGPWALAALKKEIRYLLELPRTVAGRFPPVLKFWGLEDGAESAGYEMPYFSEWTDAGSLVRGGNWDQSEQSRFAKILGDLVVGELQESLQGTALSGHVRTTVKGALDTLAGNQEFLDRIESDEIRINDRIFPGLRHAVEAIDRADLFQELDRQSTRLHGDLILENVLWNPEPTGGQPSLILIDPVSVAGIDVGHPAFDLVKYESYASGELFAIREEKVILESEGERSWSFQLPEKDPEWNRFRSSGLSEGFRSRWEDRHGPVDPLVYHLIDGYFSLAMALNTSGRHQQARVLKAIQCFGAVV